MSHVTFAGAGMIGAGLAVNAVMHGQQVTIWDIRERESLEKGVKDIFRVFVENDVVTQEKAEGIFSRLRFTNELSEAVSEAEFIQESITENLEAKRSLYRQIQEKNPKAVIASSTSLLFPSALREGALVPERILVGHPYNPAHLMPLMEICGGDEISEETIAYVKKVYESWGKVPVVCRKEVKGFLVNEINQGVLRICRDQVVQGVCSAEDMDKAVMFGPGLRMAVAGQLLTTSLGIEGGFKNLCSKYGLPPNPDYEILAEQMEELYAHRTEAEGRTPEAASKCRDKMIINSLKMRGYEWQ